MMMRIIDLSMFNVALPTIRNTFSIQADVTAWVVTAYSLPVVIFTPLYGCLGDGLSKRRLFVTGIVVFLGGTVITLLAIDLRSLILGRIIQGIGTAGITPLSITLIFERFPADEQGKALGTWNSVGPFAAMIGPFLGGFLIDHLGWRTIFGPVLLIGLVALFTVRKQIPTMHRDFVQAGFLRTFDWGGVVLLSVATILLVFYASSRPITGVEALRDWRLLTAALLSFGGFIIWEKRRVNPFVALDIFSDKNFRLASLGGGIRMFAMSSMIFLLPLYLTDVHALNAASIGIMSTLHAAALFVTMRMGGQLADRWGSRRPVIIGSSGQVGIMIYFSLLPGTVPLGLVVAGLIGHGLAAGLSLAALHRASMSKILPEQRGMAAGLYSMIRFGGIVFSAALGGVVLQYGLDRSLSAIGAYQIVFRFVAAVVSLGVVIGWGLEE